jgi:hypothetical protein
MKLLFEEWKGGFGGQTNGSKGPHDVGPSKNEKGRKWANCADWMRAIERNIGEEENKKNIVEVCRCLDWFVWRMERKAYCAHSFILCNSSSFETLRTPIPFHNPPVSLHPLTSSFRPYIEKRND